jgi:phosphopantothenate-cysteine ligase
MNILITSGGTLENIDEVRSITNMSTGELGTIIANTLLDFNFFIDKVFFLSNKKMILPFSNHKLEIIYTSNTDSVLSNMKTIIKNNKIDFVIHAMAISDYKVDKVFNESNIIDVLNKYLYKINDLDFISSKIVNEINGIDNSSKISSNNDNLFIKLSKTPKIVDLIKTWDPNINLISFKLLNNVSEEELITVAKKQLDRTNSNLVIANDLFKIRDGNHKAFFIERDSIKIVEGKDNIAYEILSYIKIKRF